MSKTPVIMCAGCLLSVFLRAGLSIADEATIVPPPLPKVKSLGALYYPDQAKRQQVEGSVLVEFSIDAEGKSNDVKLIRSDSRMLSDMAMKSFAAAKYVVPTEWNNDNSATRFRVVMVFCLPPSKQTTTFRDSPYDPIIVAGSRIGHPPVQTIPGTCKAQQ